MTSGSRFNIKKPTSIVIPFASSQVFSNVLNVNAITMC